MHVGRDAQNKFATISAERDTVVVVVVLYSSRKRAGEVAWPNGACEVSFVARGTTSALPLVLVVLCE
jgi:hypothetical protein